MSFESSCNKFFVNSLGPTASMSSTCTPMQMSSSSVHEQTRVALILTETMFFQLDRQVFLPETRRCSETLHGLTHSPNHKSAIRQNLRVPAFRWLCVQLFAFTDFSVEKSFVCSLPQKLRVPDLVCRDTLPRAYGCLHCCCSCKATLT